MEMNIEISEAINKAIKLRKEGLSPISIIKALREEFGIGLNDAKRIYNYSISEEERKAQEKFIDELCSELEKAVHEN